MMREGQILRQTSEKEDGEIPFRQQDMKWRALVGTINVLQAESRQRGIDFADFRDDYEWRDSDTGEPQDLDGRAQYLIKLAGYRDALQSGLLVKKEKRASETVGQSERCQYWIEELLNQAQIEFGRALANTKHGTEISKNLENSFPLAKMVMTMNADSQLTKTDRRALDEVVLALQLKWVREVYGLRRQSRQGSEVMSHESGVSRQEIVEHLLTDPKLLQAIFEKSDLKKVLETVPREVVAAAAAEASVGSGLGYETIREVMLQALPWYQTPRKSAAESVVSQQVFNRLVQYFTDKSASLARAYKQVHNMTSPEAASRVVVPPEKMPALLASMFGKPVGKSGAEQPPDLPVRFNSPQVIHKKLGHA